MFKLTTFIPYEIIIIYTVCSARAYADCMIVRACECEGDNYTVQHYNKE